MRLRQLQMKDAPAMLGWMHDPAVVGKLHAEKFLKSELSDCECFIAGAMRDGENLHRAVTDDSDEYMGTVSLKNIDWKAKDGEFAIALRGEAHGRGYGRFAMNGIMEIAFEELDLEEVYWIVRVDNLSAIRLYDRGGYENMGLMSQNTGLKPDCGADSSVTLRYRVTREQYFASHAPLKKERK